MVHDHADIHELVGQYRHIDKFASAVQYVSEQLRSLNGLTVLEAGCGSGSYLNLENCHVVGIDLSQKQLDKNQQIQEKYLGDLHTFSNDDWNGKFDLIVCWDVIEHLCDPKRVIDKFIIWTKAGGLILLAFPNPQTLKAVVTKYTPIAFHRFAKRLARPGTTAQFHCENTFKTYMRKDMRLNRIADQVSDKECEIPFIVSHQSGESRFYKRFVGEKLMDSVNSFFLGNLRGFIDKRSTDLILVIKKPKAGP